jgi:hypothetical protein
MSKVKKKDDKQAALQWAKTLRDLVEIRNVTLEKIKAHLLGRDETGAVKEPCDFYSDDDNPEVAFERSFNWAMTPWTREDLKLTCKECGKDSEEVWTRNFPGKSEDSFPFNEIKPAENIDLCNECYEEYEKIEPEIEEQIQSLSPEDRQRLSEFFETQGRLGSSGQKADPASVLAELTVALPEHLKLSAIEGFKRRNQTDVLEKIKALEGDRGNAGSAW